MTALATKPAIQQPVNDSPMNTVLTMVNNGVEVPVETLERVFAMQERMDANRAKEAFNRAMADAQTVMPNVIKDRKNEQTNSMYATHEAVNRVAKPVWLEHGFSLSFSQVDSQKPDHVRIRATVRHSEGHSEEHFAEGPLDGVGIKGTSNKTPMHATASTYTYLCRILTCQIFNITIAGQDTDGNNPADAELITGAQLKEVEGLLKETGSDLKRFLGFVGKDELKQMTWGDYKRVMPSLQRKVKGGGK